MFEQIVESSQKYGHRQAESHHEGGVFHCLLPRRPIDLSQFRAGFFDKCKNFIHLLFSLALIRRGLGGEVSKLF